MILMGYMNNMEDLNVQIINPKAKSILMNMEEMNLIRIKAKATLSEMLEKLRRNESEAPSLDEITEEVELVRQNRYDFSIKPSIGHKNNRIAYYA